MDSFEWNKVMGAIVGSLLLIFGGIKVLEEVVYHDQELDQLAYLQEVADRAGETQVASAAEPMEPAFDLAAALQTASAESGERVAARCAACHNFVKGGANQIGPNLWDVLGREIAAIDGFNYSNTLQGKDGAWTYEAMNAFLENPRGWAPGTSMAFAGLNRDSDRANIIAYMRQQADNPPALPEVAAAEPADAPAADAPAGEDAAPEAAADPSQDG